jgi:hypothetical protein
MTSSLARDVSGIASVGLNAVDVVKASGLSPSTSQ